MSLNYPDALNHIDITNSMYQVIEKLAKEEPELINVLDLVCSKSTKNNYYFTKLCCEHSESLNKYKLDH